MNPVQKLLLGELHEDALQLKAYIVMSITIEVISEVADVLGGREHRYRGRLVGQGYRKDSQGERTSRIIQNVDKLRVQAEEVRKQRDSIEQLINIWKRSWLTGKWIPPRLKITKSKYSEILVQSNKLLTCYFLCKILLLLQLTSSPQSVNLSNINEIRIFFIF